MGAPLVLGIDQGTSSTKCLLVNATGAIVARGQAALSETHPQPGWVEQDAEAIWTSVREAVRDCVPPDQAASVVAVGLSTQRESIVAWDRASGLPRIPGPLVAGPTHRGLGRTDRRAGGASSNPLRHRPPA